MQHRAGRRTRRLRKQLLAVLLCDASACGALIAVSATRRSEPSAALFAAVARTAVSSLVPGAIAVAHERHRHGAGRVEPHPVTSAVLLFTAGVAVATAGTVRILVTTDRDAERLPGLAADVALLIGGNAIGVPYLALVAALHREQWAGR